MSESARVKVTFDSFTQVRQIYKACETGTFRQVMVKTSAFNFCGRVGGLQTPFAWHVCMTDKCCPILAVSKSEFHSPNYVQEVQGFINAVCALIPHSLGHCIGRHNCFHWMSSTYAVMHPSVSVLHIIPSHSQCEVQK